MIERFGSIKNPLTIIAVFSALSEISGTVILPLIDKQNQSIFMWFLMLFPCLIVVLFFSTLNFNHHALYAPSDFRDERNYLHGLQPASVVEIAGKLKAEAKELSAAGKFDTKGVASTVPPIEMDSELSKSAFEKSIKSMDKRANILLVEQLVMEKIASETPHKLHRNPKLVGSSGRPLILDAAIEDGKKIEGIEIKYISEPSRVLHSVKRDIERLSEFFKRDAPEVDDTFSVMLAIVTPTEHILSASEKDQINHDISIGSFKIRVRFFNLEELQYRS